MKGQCLRAHLNLEDLFNFPNLNAQANTHADLHHEVGVIVKHVEDNNHRLEDIKKHRSKRKTLEVFPRAPELNI